MLAGHSPKVSCNQFLLLATHWKHPQYRRTDKEKKHQHIYIYNYTTTPDYIIVCPICQGKNEMLVDALIERM